MNKKVYCQQCGISLENDVGYTVSQQLICTTCIESPEEHDLLATEDIQEAILLGQ